MISPLIDRLMADHGWPCLDSAAAADSFISDPGEQVLLVPGDPARNLESDDVAVILPELIHAFRGRFRPAVVGASIERDTRERFQTWPTPSLIFLRDGAFLGAIPRVRDWEDYLSRTRQILDGAAVRSTE